VGGKNWPVAQLPSRGVIFGLEYFGAASVNRTPDPRITNAMLYQLS
jgi:hypothetical protein